MKRGVLINLAVILILVLLVVFPLLIFWITDLLANANGCDLTIGTTEGYCGSLYTFAFLAGLIGSVTSPIFLGLLGIYLTGVFLFSLWQWVLSRRSDQPIPPFTRGMLFSSVAIIGLAAITTMVIQAVNWYQVSFISDCKGLPDQSIISNLKNGLMAAGIKLPEPQGTIYQFRIVSVTSDGDQLNPLSDLPGSIDPAWSPDGNKLAFVTRPAGESPWEIHISDTTNQSDQVVFSSDIEIESPAWSPDGNSLYFNGWLENDPNPDIEIFKLDIDTGISTRIPGSTEFDGDAHPSPDGSRIAFVSQRDHSSDIYTMNTDGSNVQRLTRHPDFDIDPAWSPDGNWIVFSSNRGSSTALNNYNLYIMQPDGSNQCQLTNEPGSEWQPAWSPDGEWIAFISLLDSKVLRIKPDGSQLTPIDISMNVVGLLDLDWAAAP
jgi:Tol biopolymer transport system component